MPHLWGILKMVERPTNHPWSGKRIVADAHLLSTLKAK